MIRSRKVLDHARGQPCQARFGGICNGGSLTTVFCHLNGHGKGMGLKTHDVLGFFGCSCCHAYYDHGHGTKPLMSDLELLQSVMGAVCMTWVQLIKDGIVIVPIDAESLASERPAKPRKPREQRKAVPSSKRPIQSPGFDQTKSRKMNGTVVSREAQS